MHNRMPEQVASLLSKRLGVSLSSSPQTLETSYGAVERTKERDFQRTRRRGNSSARHNTTQTKFPVALLMTLKS